MSSLVLATVGPLLSSTAAAIGIVPHVDPNAILNDIAEGLLHIKQVLSDIARDVRATGCSMQYCQFTLGLVDHRELCEQLLEMSAIYRDIKSEFEEHFQSSQWMMIVSRDGVNLHKSMQSLLDNVNIIRRRVDRLPPVDV